MRLRDKLAIALLSTFLLGVLVVPAYADSPIIHVVSRGQTLYSIAVRYGTSVWAIRAANRLRGNLIFVGQRLKIPQAGSVRHLTGVPLLYQQQPLTCEEAAAAIASRGRVGELQLLRVMPRSPNPFEGIRGRPEAPFFGGLQDYGAYAQGLQKGLARLGVASRVYYKQSYADFKSALLAELRAGRPVIWWNTWRERFERPVWVDMPDGQRVKLVPYEHTVVLVGFDGNGFVYHDPYDASVRWVSWADHQRVSAYFDNMALVIRE